MPSQQALGDLGSGALAGFVAVERDQHPLCAVAPHGVQDIVGEALRAIGAGDVLVAGAPEGHGVDQRLTEDDFRGGGERRHVPDAAMRTGQIQVQRRVHAFGDLAPVDLGDVAGRVEHRHHQAAVEVLVPRLTQNADLLQPAAYLGAGLDLAGGQAQPQGAIGEAQPVPLDHLARTDAAFVEIGQRLGAGEQGLVVVADDLVEQFLLAGIQGHGRRQLAHERALDRAGTVTAGG